ncbi:MAG: hypothetical protein LKG16_06865 [Bifidobacterium subtile]|jgi:hypothetical protein|uniref:hypothetical protein n=1 Tax=Bifidobacterium TaxID=1678 RepID=UPI002357F4D3|nr:hypothetical protein [Bifidobacterium tibiigranuli]MCI1223080.1 hypothetical protein [Bifidobacterium subtile]MCH3973483.1 hypothetical protein [Bifidobacterium tibiigranuli]MCH4190615.1 hypothetical protein [Bifidobacterium tibiigranuli]MCI1241716.1 hypothetical protein [Bifidobacterium subtile]MCI1258923.1 hypothetical protein [Bifidobacterium subtile]
MKYLKYVALLAIAAASFASSRLLLWLVNPNDPEGTNLLVTAALAIVVFVPLSLTYLHFAKRRKAKK